MSTIKSLEAKRKTIALAILILGSVFVLYPVANMLCGSVSSKTVIKTVPSSLIPLEGKTVSIPEFGTEPLFVYNMDVNGEKMEVALVDKNPAEEEYAQKSTGRENEPDKKWKYVNPNDTSEQYYLRPAKPDDRARSIRFNWVNYSDALKKANFARYIINTLIILFIATGGAVLSATLVAYGFGRFHFKGRNVLFIILLSTMMLPSQVTLIPSFIMYKWLGWYNTYLPLTVPAFFAVSAMNVFLIRQFMLGLPLELDEAAKIDGCGPIKILWYVIVPQSKPVILTISLTTAIFWWNDFYYALIYLQDKTKYTVALGLQSFNALYFNNSGLMGAATVMVMIPPLVIFFIFQKYFIQGTVISGVKG
ncbi:MAG: carbohydrate ABC transporter permease [Treponema sp.]|nr:carbohydrate ABC transporter permease [Treponema sp.]